MTARNAKDGGFTLLEVIVAISIISMLVVTFAPLIVSSIQRIQWAGERMEELYALHNQMERDFALENKTRSQTLTIKGDFGYSRTIQGIVVQVDEFVSFLSPKE